MTVLSSSGSHETLLSATASGVAPQAMSSPTFRALWTAMIRSLRGLSSAFSIRRSEKRMRVTETVQLGDKRLVALLQVDGKTYLLGASTSAVSLLAALEPQSQSLDIVHPGVAQGASGK